MTRRRREKSDPAHRSATQVGSAAKVSPAGWRRRRLIGAAAVALIAGAVGWFGFHHAGPAPPLPELSAVDPKVAATIKQHWAEAAHNPRSASAWGWLGAVLRVYDFRPEACECLAWAEQLDPGNPRWPYYHGLALMIAKPADAIPRFRRAAQLCGTDPAAPRMRLARLLGEQGQWEEVQAELDPLLQAKPDFAPARLLSARAAQAKGNPARAVGLARSCTDDPRTARSAWALLAILYREQGDAVAAAAAVQRSATAAADEGMGDPFLAEVTLLRPDPRALSEEAHPLLAGGHLAEASALIDRLVREHPNFPDTWLLLGRLQLLRRDVANAEKSLRHHLELDPQSAQGLFQLGSTLLAQDRFREAAEVFGKATQLKADFGPAHYNRGFALARAGQLREAASAFQESLRHNPERLETYILLADLRLQLREPEAALQLLNQAQAINPTDPRLKALRDRARRAAE
jgi:tetratricopeptide (TPR) repeat protein